MEVARSFSVAGKPFGIDQAHGWEDKIDEILEWCPEYHLAMLGRKSVDL